MNYGSTMSVYTTLDVRHTVTVSKRSAVEKIAKEIDVTGSYVIIPVRKLQIPHPNKVKTFPIIPVVIKSHTPNQSKSILSNS